MNGSCNMTSVESPRDLAPGGDEEHISLCETLDRVLNKGVVIGGEAMISVAGIDLIYLGLTVILTSVETAREMCAGSQRSGVDRNQRAA